LHPDGTEADTDSEAATASTRAAVLQQSRQASFRQSKQGKEKCMKRILFGNIALVLLLTASVSQSADHQPPLHTRPLSAEFARGRDQVLPSPRERSFRNIAWRTSVLHGILDAQKKDRPVMIVLMNGHPLGCT
jgi:hypothetical protein